MGECKYCHRSALTISDVVGFCAECVREHFKEVWPAVESIHRESRRRYGLPDRPPRAENGVACPLCFHECRIPEGSSGYCGLRHVENGKLRGGRPQDGNLSYYCDALPTNCVASFVCPAGSDCGFPAYSVSRGPEYGRTNLAVFYQACSFNCLYCQNFHFKELAGSSGTMSAEELAAAVDANTTCICYFGGDPSPQILHALEASRRARKRAEGRVLRICWETNGASQRPFLERMARLSMESGGCIKFDLKAWDDRIHHALCGVTNRQTLENFRFLSTLTLCRPEPPLLVASTLMVPGYVDEAEVAAIARFLTELDPSIPYSLLAFYPQFYMEDLPATSRGHAARCKEAAERAGLKTVRLGNVHLLGENYP